MSYLNIKLKKKLKFRLDLSQLIPGKIGKKTKTEIKTLEISYGNEKRNISDFFSISGTLKNGIIFKGDLSKCDYIGNQMKNGEIIINGNAGNYLGNKIKDHFSFGEKLDVKIEYIEEKKPKLLTH